MAQRSELIALTKRTKVDNTGMRRILRLLDFEAEEIAILETTGHAEPDQSSHYALSARDRRYGRNRSR